MILKLGTMKKKELATWFGITEKSFENARKKYLQKLESFAKFIEIRGGVIIEEIYIPTFVKPLLGGRAKAPLRSLLAPRRSSCQQANEFKVAQILGYRLLVSYWTACLKIFIKLINLINLIFIYKCKRKLAHENFLYKILSLSIIYDRDKKVCEKCIKSKRKGGVKDDNPWNL